MLSGSVVFGGSEATALRRRTLLDVESGTTPVHGGVVLVWNGLIVVAGKEVSVPAISRVVDLTDAM